MASSGPLSGGTFVSDSSSGGTVAWTNPSNASASDNARATAVTTNFLTTEYLKATNFGFAIPATATIDGIVAEVERSNGNAFAGTVKDHRVRIVKGGTIGASDKALATAWPFSSESYQTYGSISDLWGETWTPADINGSTFGMAISAFSQESDSSTARIDHIRITVYYTEAGNRRRRFFSAAA